jgi:hypothetical protein
MSIHKEVLAFLRPDGGYVARGQEYEGIEFLECEPFTKEEWLAAFSEYQSWKTEQEEKAQKNRQALLDKLGITEDEAQLLLGGN